jgi:hypothetical protein
MFSVVLCQSAGIVALMILLRILSVRLYALVAAWFATSGLRRWLIGVLSTMAMKAYMYRTEKPCTSETTTLTKESPSGGVVDRKPPLSLYERSNQQLERFTSRTLDASTFDLSNQYATSLGSASIRMLFIRRHLSFDVSNDNSGFDPKANAGYMPEKSYWHEY